MINPKGRSLFLLTAFVFSLSGAFISFAGATFSDAWTKDTDGSWKVTENGSFIRDAWICDDSVPENGKEVWYLLDKNGCMVSAGLLQDERGDFYSLETSHNGYFGMMRHTSGTYDGIRLELEDAHHGTFGKILNKEGIEALTARYGITKISGTGGIRCVYTSELEKGNTATGEGNASGSVRKAELKEDKAAGSASSFGTLSRDEHFVRTDQVTKEMVNAVFRALSAKETRNPGTRYYLTNTGIRFDNYAEGYAAAACLRELIMGDRQYEILFMPAERVYADPGAGRSYRPEGVISDHGYIFAGWRENADPDAVLAQHLNSKAAVDSLVAASPDGLREKALYFHDRICEMTGYDHEGTEKHYAYSAFSEGRCVCSGYSQAYFNLAFYSGLPAVMAECIAGGEEHSINAVRENGIWYRVDCTWDDGEPVTHRYFMDELGDSWQKKFSGPPAS